MTKADKLFEEWFEGRVPEYDDEDYVGSMRDIAEVAWNKSKEVYKLKKNYFVSFTFVNKRGFSGNGNICVKLDSKITVKNIKEALEEFERLIHRNDVFESVVIMNYIEVPND